MKYPQALQELIDEFSFIDYTIIKSSEYIYIINF